MGEVNKLAERQSQIDSISKSVSGSVDKLNSTRADITGNNMLKAVKAGADKFVEEVDGSNLTTSTKSDNGPHEKSLASKGVDIFLDARSAKLEKLKHDAKEELKTRDKELEKLQKEIEESKRNMEKTRARAENNPKYTDAQKDYYQNLTDRAQEKIDAQGHNVADLREKISDAKNHRSTKVKFTEQEKTRFVGRKSDLKDVSKNAKNTKLDKLGGKSSKLNQKKSLDKLRGKNKAVEKVKVETKKKIVKKTGKKVAGEVAKKAAAKGAVKAVASKAVAAAAGAFGWVVVVAAIVIIIVVLIVLILMMFMSVLSGDEYENSVRNSNYSTSAVAEMRTLYSKLDEHFGGNEIPVLGIMCNIQGESSFISYNLEDKNETAWGTSDEEYTAKVNAGFGKAEGTPDVVTKEDFCKDTYLGDVRRYYDEDEGWKNPDGGYGYCQYTEYTQKQRLYDYATTWFSTGGEGEGQDFNIGDPEMQASYIVYMLEHYIPDVDRRLRSAESVYEAAYIWCDGYENPAGDHSEKAADRAQAAYAIANQCSDLNTGGSSGSGQGGQSGQTEQTAPTGEVNQDGQSGQDGQAEQKYVDFSAVDGTYIYQVESGPCVTCAIANMVKRYCYMQGDERWDEIVPELITDEGARFVDAIDDEDGAIHGWGCFDTFEFPHLEVTSSDWCPFEGDKTITVHGYECRMHNVYGCPTREELISLLDAHPEGIVVTASYCNGEKGHGKLITRYDSATGAFYCVDPGSWGSSLPGHYDTQERKLDPRANGRIEQPLVSSECWQDVDTILQYRYIEHVGD